MCVRRFTILQYERHQHIPFSQSVIHTVGTWWCFYRCRRASDIHRSQRRKNCSWCRHGCTVAFKFLIGCVRQRVLTEVCDISYLMRLLLRMLTYSSSKIAVLHVRFTKAPPTNIPGTCSEYIFVSKMLLNTISLCKRFWIIYNKYLLYIALFLRVCIGSYPQESFYVSCVEETQCSSLQRLVSAQQLSEFCKYDFDTIKENLTFTNFSLFDLDFPPYTQSTNEIINKILIL